MAQSHEALAGVLTYGHGRVVKLGEAYDETKEKLAGRTWSDLKTGDALQESGSDLAPLLRAKEQLRTDIWDEQSAGKDHLRLNNDAIVDMAHMAAEAAGVQIQVIEQSEQTTVPVTVNHG